MPAKLTEKQRIGLVEKVALQGKTVKEVCQKAGISRVLFYRWLKRYKEKGILAPQKPKVRPSRLSKELQSKIISLVKLHPEYSSKKLSSALGYNKQGRPLVGNHGVQNTLARLKLNTEVKRQAFSRKTKKLLKRIAWEELSPNKRLEAIERAVKYKEPVTRVCQVFDLSRPTFYKWSKRYSQAEEGKKLEALQNRRPQIERYYRQTPEKYEQAVLSLIAQNPEFGVRKLVSHLPKIAGSPIVGHHGVQNVLRRHNLSLYEQRLTYTKAQITPFVRLVAVLEQAFAKLFAFSPETRTAVIRFLVVTATTALSTITLLGVFNYLSTVFGAAAPVSQLGLFFASTALLVGSVFFVYSMKYYFTLALVLSFSRQTSQEGKLTVSLSNGNGNGGNWLKRVFGLKNGNGNGLKPQNFIPAGGLQPNLDHIKLERYPFVSIHLPFYNEKKVVNRILSACTALDYPNYEVIVCDDSTDETVEILKTWEGHQKIKILHRLNRAGFKGGALKYAIKHMNPKTEFVLVFDADFIPYPDTITQFLKYFKATGGWEEKVSYQADRVRTVPYETFKKIEIDPQEKEFFARQEKELSQKSNIAVVAGYQWHVLNKSENWITRGVRSEYAGSYIIERPGQEILGALKIIHGSTYAIRADILKHFGWGTSITEDFELTLRIYEKGFKVVYTPYIQAPSECVSTIKRLIRQRMRWSEGHSFNVKKMFLNLLRSSRMTIMEKIEFLYISPYYLQAFFFLIGTFSWLISEAVFKVKLPFWTSLWGWSLVLTNFFALPLVNAVGLFLEESEEKDYSGLLSFVALSYLLVPFQAYAAVKGFLEKEEGPWFRTPKTGRITDIFSRGKFYRWIAGILPGRRVAAPTMESLPISSYLALATANNRFNSFAIQKKRRLGWVAKTALSFLLCLTTTLLFVSSKTRLVYANNYENIMKLGIGSTGEAVWPAWGNRFENNSAGYEAAGVTWQWSNSTAQLAVTNNFMWFTNMMPTGSGDAVIYAGNNVMLQIAKQGGGPTTSNWINFTVQLLLTNNNATAEVSPAILQQNFQLNTANANGTLWTFGLGNISANTNIAAASPNRFALLIGVTTSRRAGTNINFWINNATVPARLIMPQQIQVPEIPQTVVFIIMLAIIPTIPAIVSGRLRKKNGNIFQEFRDAWQEILAGLLGKEEEKALDKLPV